MLITFIYSLLTYDTIINYHIIIYEHSVNIYISYY